MTAGSRGHRFKPTNEQMAALLTQIRLLLDALENPAGTTLDPDEIVEGLEALRQRRFQIIPPREPKVVLVEHADWSNLDEVPLAALGLRETTYEAFIACHIRTVGLLVAHSRAGLSASGVYLGRQRVRWLLERLHAHNLELAENDSKIPISYIIEHSHLGGLVGWWTPDDQYAFADALGLKALLDVARLTVERIKTVQFGDYTGRPSPIVRPMSPENPSDVKLVVNELNALLTRYHLPAINNT